ncbi:signal recognition particle-docking protein FtsY [Corynebacterium spheniscorum]|uniref:Signal recognition particle receptor FtsY n=1 Tax=Corynebacterium spheniscorum TaxID=185761 RepID=A0A1I2R9P3_9CORY|nr:signal recognition particle-docking protein FtsY [Corynebacterium spheniscorum]
MTPTISWMTVGIIAAVVILILLVIVVLVGKKRREAKTVRFAKEEAPKELTREEKSGDYQAKGGFNFAPAVTDAATGPAKKEPELLANQQLHQEAKPKAQPGVGESNAASMPVKLETPAKPETPAPKAAEEKPLAPTEEAVVEEETEAASAPIVMPEDRDEDTKVEAVAEPATEVKPEPEVEAEPAPVVQEEAEAASAPIVMPEDSQVEAPAEPAEPAAEPTVPSEPRTEAVSEEAAEEASAPIVMAEDSSAKASETAGSEAVTDRTPAENLEPEAAAVPPVPDTPEPQEPEAAEAQPQVADTPEPKPQAQEAHEAAEAAQSTVEGAEAALAEPHPAPSAETEVAPVPETQQLDDIAPAAGRIGRLRGRLSRSQNAIGQGLLGILTAGDLDEDAWEEIEDTLIMADLGASVTAEVVDQLREKIAAHGVSSEAEARAMLRETLIDAGRPDMDRSIKAMPYQGKPAVVLVVGVNGTGKTTTTGKLARVLTSMGHKVLLGAADTFRAAAADQLETWGRRVGATTVRGKEGADPASVAFDAVARGVEEHADVVLVDTAGRLHTSQGLMDQLGKVKRVVEKKAKVDEVLLVLDATVGQNGLMQARIFRDVVDITGVVLTKLDGTAKGGIVFRVQEELGVPVKLVGLGEGADDLAPFEVEGFVDALLGSKR